MTTRKTIHEDHEPSLTKAETSDGAGLNHGAAHDESNWLISYADMMTLLCGFFIMLFSMAKMDVPKYDSFKEAIAKQFGGEYVSPSKEMAKAVSEVLKQMDMEDKAVVKSDSNGVSIVFQSTVFFGTLSAEVSHDGYNILDKLIKSVETRQKEQKKTYRIVVEGHTDSRPVVGGLYPSNWELSGARAARVVRMFLEHNFTPDHLTAIGYADTHPQAPAKTPNGSWDENALGKNRRVVLRILEPSIDSIPFPEDGGSKSAEFQAPNVNMKPLPDSSPVPAKILTNAANK
jgi:chemotaxis protein MotB